MIIVVIKCKLTHCECDSHSKIEVTPLSEFVLHLFNHSMHSMLRLDACQLLTLISQCAALKAIERH